MDFVKQLEYHIGGVPVKFPCKPYPTQMAMMAKIIQALSHRENALLESPTGSGKSLALLCSALAWQKQEYLKIEQEEVKEALKGKKQDISMTCICDCHDRKSDIHPQTPSTSYISHAGVYSTTRTNFNESNHSGCGVPFSLSALPLGGSLGTINSGSGPSDAQPLVFGRKDPEDIIQLDGTTGPTSTSVVGDPLGQNNQNEKAGNVETVKLSDDSCVGETIPSSHRQQEDEMIKTSQDKKCDSVKIGANQTANECAGKYGATDEKDDGDFKTSHKRFRTPSSTAEKTTVAKRRKLKKKGIEYEDVPGLEVDNDAPNIPPDGIGHPKWRMEFPDGVVSSVGVPQSQIIDSDLRPREHKQEIGGPFFVPTCQSTHVSTICPKCGCGRNEGLGMSAKVDNIAMRRKAPKIYFGTRTHKQITQITHEMARTAYTGVPMCILASREHTCIHPQVSKSKNKNEECKKLLDYADGVSCSFHHNVQKRLGSQAQLRQQGFSTAWDIEDLVTLGKRIRTCPYFTTRGLVEEADIVFCPYNYLIDPLIRDQMSVDIENKVIILDEAHNMEDSAREAASLSVSNVQLLEISKEIKQLLTDSRLGELRNSYLQMQAFCTAVIRWIEATSETLPARGYEQAYGIWNGKDFLPILEKHLGITAITLEMYKGHLGAINEANADKEQRETLPSISVNSLSVFKSMFMVMGYLFKNSMQYLQDYRMALMKSMMSVSRAEPGGWMSRRRKSRVQDKVWTFTLNFWCLNPAVAFSEMSKARSIILTSGTLSPMSSFSSELGVTFPIQLEANHVIPESQTWVTSISHGPSGKSLIANYQNTETFDFQDELGETVLRICQTVPYGVLCFFSSYKMLEKLTNRWQDTGLWYKMLHEKFIVSEPRSGKKEDFETAMTSFYSVVAESSPDRTADDGESCQTGALFLAVCRGKVSEGLDFANNNARAVITVGIPFPSIKDKQVELKREYNNEHTRSRGLLSGSEWYEIQAYRALNQALGRCIRHKKDWGALILVDERYSKGPHYTKGLSKWVRQRIKHEKDFSHAISSLRTFTDLRMKADSSEANTTCGSSILFPNKSPVACGSPSLGVSMSSPQIPHHNSLSLSATPHRDTCSSTILYASGLPASSSKAIQPPSVTAGLIPCNLSSTPIPPRSTSKSKITDFIFSTSSPIIPNHSSQLKDTCNVDNVCTPLSPSSELPIAKGDLKQEQVSSAHVRHSSRFQYPGGLLSASNEAISLSQIQSLASTMPIAHEHEQEAVVCCSTTSPGPHNDTTVKYTQQLGQPYVPVPPTLIALEDSLEMVEEACCSHNLQTSICPNQAVLEHKDLDKDETKLEYKASQVTPPHCSPREESPLLFETPSTVGGHRQQLAMKLAKRAIAADRIGSLNVLKLSPNENSRSENVDDIDATPPLSQHNDSETPKKTVVNSSPVARASTSMHKSQSSSSISVKSPALLKTRRGRKANKSASKSSPLGQPKVRRANTRLTSKRTATGEHSKQQLLTSFCYDQNVEKNGLESVTERVDSDQVDFTTVKPLRDKQPSTTDKLMQGDVVRCCSCGKILSTGSNSTEEMELKQAFSKCYGSHKPQVIYSSQLWQHLKGETKPRRRTLNTLLVSSSVVKCLPKEGIGEYNAVWDDKLGICYKLLKCTCDCIIGASIQSANDASQSIVGKTLLVVDQVVVSKSLPI